MFLLPDPSWWTLFRGQSWVIFVTERKCVTDSKCFMILSASFRQSTLLLLAWYCAVDIIQVEFLLLHCFLLWPWYCKCRYFVFFILWVFSGNGNWLIHTVSIDTMWCDVSRHLPLYEVFHGNLTFKSELQYSPPMPICE